jgi:hypothetical protein
VSRKLLWKISKEPHLKTARFNVKGKSAHDGPISGSVGTTITRRNFRAYVNNRGAKLEGKYADKASGGFHADRVLQAD